MNETEEITSCKFATIKTIDLGEKVEVAIVKQADIKFSYVFKIDGEDVIRKTGGTYGDSRNYIRIASIDSTQYYENDYPVYYTFFMQGGWDFDKGITTVRIPKTIWAYFKKALESLGADIDTVETETVEEDIARLNYSTSDLTPTEEEIDEMISLVDLDTFCKVIKNRVSKELPTDKRDILGKLNRKWAKDYLKNWAVSKYRFYKILGNKLTISCETEVSCNENSFREAINELRMNFPLYNGVFEHISCTAFEQKEVNKKNIAKYFFEDKRVTEGMSITKFISLYGNKELDTEISKMYQDIGKNTLYITINPIDYLTVSINGSGWDSCHHFLNGCYRNAGLSYMVDKTSLIAYASRKDVNYPFEFPYKWNTKNWRQMIYMSTESSTTVFSRQYPYDSDELSREIRQMFEEKICSFFNSENKWKVYSNKRECDLSVQKNDYALLYNDVDEGFRHKVIKAKDDEKYNFSEVICIGGKVNTLLDKEMYLDAPENFLIDNYNSEYDDYDEEEEEW